MFTPATCMKLRQLHCGRSPYLGDGRPASILDLSGRRHRFLRAQRELLCIVISALNFELLGFPTVPPAEACTGHPLSRDQHEVLERIEAMLAHFLKMQKFQSDDLGRITTKFQDVIRIVKELPTHVSTHDTTRLEDLTVLLQQMHADFDHYSRSSRVTSPCQHA